MVENVIKCSKENDAAATVARFLSDQDRTVRFRIFPGMLSRGEWDIDLLELTQRSYNSLKRNGIETIGELAEKINGLEDLLKCRNLGIKSAREILFKLYLFQYQVLPAERKPEYLREVIALNRLMDQHDA